MTRRNVCGHHHQHQQRLSSVLVTLPIRQVAAICPPRAGHFSQLTSLPSHLHSSSPSSSVIGLRNRQLAHSYLLRWPQSADSLTAGVQESTLPRCHFSLSLLFPPLSLGTGQVASLCSVDDTTMASRERKDDDDDDENWRNHRHSTCRCWHRTELDCCCLIAVVSGRAT